MAQLFLPTLEPPAPLTPSEHYGFDPIGAALGLEGAGPLAYMTGDQLHPPMVDDEVMWRTGAWRAGAIRHVHEAAELCGVRRGQRVLDVGCGIGGAARVLARDFGARVVGTNITRSQLETARRIDQAADLTSRIRYIEHDCQAPYPRRIGLFHVAWSMNMLYHVSDIPAMLGAVCTALRPRGRLMIDDWMLTPRATEAERASLSKHFVSPHFAVREELVAAIASHPLRIVHWRDLGHVGRTHLATHFRSAFEAHFRGPIERAHGSSSADGFVAGIEHTIDLYRLEKLTYVRLVAERT